MSNGNSVSGVGVLVTKAIVDKAIKAGYFTQAEWDEEDARDICIDRIGVKWQEAGIRLYSTRFYLQVPGNTLGEIINNSNGFLKKVRHLGINISKEDLIIIDDEYIYD